jgi:hypothetical protein
MKRCCALYYYVKICLNNLSQNILCKNIPLKIRIFIMFNECFTIFYGNFLIRTFFG